MKAASQGAGITLLCGCGEFTATFESATRCAEVLGNRELRDAGDGFIEIIPIYKIPLEEIHLALGKLSARFSVALIDLVCDKNTSRFVLVWKIIPSGHNGSNTPQGPKEETKPGINWDEY